MAAYTNITKKLIICLILFILVIDCSIIVSGYDRSDMSAEKLKTFFSKKFSAHFSQRYKPTPSLYNPYEAQDINPKDAAYHKAKRASVEWWYFEGIFDNGYSVIIGASLISKGRFGICTVGFQVYNNTQVETRLKKSGPIKEFEISEDYPSIKISGKQFITFDRERYNKTGEWGYNISLELEGQSVNLQFLGTTKGYRGEILRGWYGPVLPKATVNGTLILNGEQINVSGTGYHEHAWGIHLPIWENGWHWGKITSDSFNLFWVKMMQTRGIEQQRFAVLSQDQMDHIQINPESIRFKATKYTINNRRIIPTKFILNISDPENSIYVNVTMETANIHLTQVKINRYWRYHVRVNGQITYNSTTETITDEIQIMELTRFPSLIPIW